MTKIHSFHIPVMGIGYTLDTPLKVAPLGIDSVISLVDDSLLERLRKMYCEKFKFSYEEIPENAHDFRAERITSYLNMMNRIVSDKFDELKKAASKQSSKFKEYFDLLPDSSHIREEFDKFSSNFGMKDLKNFINEHFKKGSIDVNIMTKVNKVNYLEKETLPVEYNDALAAFRGFAKSDLNSSVVLSAGINPALYNYMQKFDDFYPDENGVFKKKIVLKVSDFRSALIQGKFLAKKGLWVSEYRIESGVNCGGHAFASEGRLMGVILEEYKNRKDELKQTIYDILVKALADKGKPVPQKSLNLRITAQGGIGTAFEHDFLLDYYGVDSVGWGTPFLLVPEATTVDKATLQQLVEAKEDDLYLSNISPLGIPFNSLKGNTQDLKKEARIALGRPGSRCTKNYAAINNREFTERDLCTASRRYQYLKIKELDSKDLSPDMYRKEYAKIVDKSCICAGLGTSSLLAYDLSTKREGDGVSICPGPNLAYFNDVYSLKDMIDHIYGRKDLTAHAKRPNMFIKELNIYIEILRSKFIDTDISPSKNDYQAFMEYITNLKEGIIYYYELFNKMKNSFGNEIDNILSDLSKSEMSLNTLVAKVDKSFSGTEA